MKDKWLLTRLTFLYFVTKICLAVYLVLKIWITKTPIDFSVIGIYCNVLLALLVIFCVYRIVNPKELK